MCHLAISSPSLTCYQGPASYLCFHPWSFETAPVSFPVSLPHFSWLPLLVYLPPPIKRFLKCHCVSLSHVYIEHTHLNMDEPGEIPLYLLAGTIISRNKYFLEDCHIEILKKLFKIGVLIKISQLLNALPLLTCIPVVNVQSCREISK